MLVFCSALAGFFGFARSVGCLRFRYYVMGLDRRIWSCGPLLCFGLCWKCNLLFLHIAFASILSRSLALVLRQPLAPFDMRDEGTWMNFRGLVV